MVSTTQQKTGQIVQIIGSTFDVEFEEGHLPDDLQRPQDQGDDRRAAWTSS